MERQKNALLATGTFHVLYNPEVCKDLEFLGVDFDDNLNNNTKGKEANITKPSSKVKVLVVPTNEELVIAQDTMEIVKGLQSQPRNMLW